MRKVILVLAAALVGSIVPGGEAIGCGDKFVVLGRGARFARVHAAPRPAAILIYRGRGSRMPAAEQEYKLEQTLRLAGHRSVDVSEESELLRALESRKYDLALGDASDVATLTRAVSAASSAAVVIPVLYHPTETELAGAEKQYGCLVNASAGNDDLLSVIDEAMREKSKGIAANCQKPR
jgi:hypothetical protein